MKTQSTKSSTATRSLLTLTFGCALACLPFGQASAQDVGPAPVPAATPAATTETTVSTTPAAASAAAPASAKLTHEEKMFIKKAGAGNAAEVKAGELAATNAESQEVKDFGTQMTKDHGDANTDLATVAKSHDLAFAPEPMAKQKMQYEKLSTLKGAAFDKAYVKAMVKDHEKDLAEYKMEKSEAKDADLKAYVDKTEAIVAEHLKMIKDIQSKMMSDKKS